MKAYIELAHTVFGEIEKRLSQATTDVSIWSAAAATPRMEPVESSDMGWMLSARLPGHAQPAFMSVALTPGEARVGVVLPKTAVEHKTISMPDRLSECFSGKPANIVRRMPGGGLLLDWHFQDDPFSASWMREALTRDEYRQAIEYRLAFIMLTVWRAVIEIIATMGHFDLSNDLMVITDRAFPSMEVARQLPCVIYDAMYQADTHQWFTILRSSLDQEEMQKALQAMDVKADVRPMMRVDVE